MRVQLTLIDGEKIDRRVHLESVTIGRSKACDIVIVSEGISRKHCLVEIKEGEFYITDLGSINGVFIDGKQINPHEPTHFKSFLNVTFGPVIFAQFTAENTLSGMILQLKKQFENLTNPKIKPLELENIQQIPQPTIGTKLAIRPTTKSTARYKPAPKKNNLAIINFIFFFGILIILYHYLFEGDNPIKTETSSPIPSNSKKLKIIESEDHF